MPCGRFKKGGTIPLTCMSPMMRGLKAFHDTPPFQGARRLLTCMSPMMRGLKAPSHPSVARANVPSTYMHVPDDEGIESSPKSYRLSTSTTYMHVPDDEGIERYGLRF